MSLVLPGRAPDTSFGTTARLRMQNAVPEAYADLAKRVFTNHGQSSAVTNATDVAVAVWRAATDPKSPSRIFAGADAEAMAASAAAAG